VLKDYIKTQFALNFGVEFHSRHIYAINVTIRPASLNKTFKDKDRLWKKDTTISFTSPQGIFGYQFWASERVALYFVGALTVHSLSAGESQSNNKCPEKPKPWTINSFAPSTGFYLDVRRPQLEPHGGYRDHYFRFKFMANPVNFSTIGKGVLYDMGVGYSF
jgi:hypothetical protein